MFRKDSRSDYEPLALVGRRLTSGLTSNRSRAPLVVAGPGGIGGGDRLPVREATAYLGLARVTGRSIHVVDRPRSLRRGLSMAELADTHATAIAGHFGAAVDIMGISTGGAVALQIAVDRPATVRRLVVVAAASWLGDFGRDALRRYGVRVAAGRSGALILASILAPPWLRWPAAAALWIGERLERHTKADVMLATIDAECDFDVTARLGRIEAPTLVIGGARDRAFSPALFQATAAGIPNARLILYPRAGHLGTMWNPRFGTDVSAFLAEPETRASPPTAM